MLRYQHKGSRRHYGLGPAHDVSLAEARCQALEIRKMVRAGPLAQTKHVVTGGSALTTAKVTAFVSRPSV